LSSTSRDATIIFMWTGIAKKEETYAVLRGHKGAADR